MDCIYTFADAILKLLVGRCLEYVSHLSLGSMLMLRNDGLHYWLAWPACMAVSALVSLMTNIR